MQFFSPKTIRKIPTTAGVYQFYRSDSAILYIGKAKNLAIRVSSYFHPSRIGDRRVNFTLLIDSIRIIPVASEYEALLLEARLIKQHQPKYNVIWKDDKHYIYVKITGEEFPRLLFARREDEKEATFFGPFPSKNTVRQILTFTRTIIPYCTQNPKIKRPCFYTHLGLCQPCPAAIRLSTTNEFKKLKKQYLHNIRYLKFLLEGKTKKVHRYLLHLMERAAAQEDFEEAAKFRDRLHSLNQLTASYQAVDVYLENPWHNEEVKQEELKQLQALLLAYYPGLPLPRRIECYDISNISRYFAVGSMVTFTNGLPDKSFYRRFRIRTVTGQNDFAMLKEVMSRRLRHREWKLPDLFVIDGGKPQLAVLTEVTHYYNLKIPLIGLAKQNEEIVIPQNKSFDKIRLPQNSPALHLVQRLRDEAHRFAHAYHENLRLRYMLTSS